MASLLDLFVRITADPSEYKKAMKESRESTEQFAKFAEAAGVRIATSLSFAGIAVAAVETAEKFEKAGFQIQRATGAAGEKLESLKTSMENLYAQSSRGADEIAGVLSQLAIRTGAQGKELENLAGATLRFVKVTGGDLQEAVKSNQKLFAQWQVDTADQARAMDMLYVASTRSGQSAQYFTDVLTQMGPTLRSFGYSFKDAVALVGTFARAGLDAADATRGLNTMFAKVAAEGKNPREVLAALIDKLAETKSSAAAAAELIDAGFSKRAVLGMVDALQKGALKVDEFRKALDGSAGAVKKSASETQTLGEAWTKLLHSLQVDIAPAGAVVLDVLDKMVQGVGVTIKAFKELGKAILSGTTGKPPEPSSVDEFDAEMAKTYGSNYWERTDAAGKVAAAMREKFIADHPQTTRPGASLDKPGSIVGSGPGFGGSFTVNQSVQYDLLRQAADRAKKAVEEFYGAGVEGAKKFAYAETDTAEEANKFLWVLRNGQPVIAEMVELPAKSFSESLSPAIRGTEEAMHSLGIASLRELRAQYDAAMAAAQAMVINGAGVADVGAAMKRVAELHKELSQRMGKWTDETRVNVRTLGQELVQMTHRMFDNISRSIARNLVDWKGWGESLKNIVKTIAEDVLNILISSLLKPLEDRLGKMLGKIGGGGGSVASSAGGSAGGAGGGAASGAASGVMGTIGAVSAAVGAVSSVIGNFQMAGMNKSLDVLVNHTLRIFNELYQFRADAWSRHTGLLQKLDDMWRTSLNIYDLLGKGGGVGGGKGGVQVNFYGPVNGDPNAIAQSIFDKLALANG